MKGEAKMKYTIIHGFGTERRYLVKTTYLNERIARNCFVKIQRQYLNETRPYTCILRQEGYDHGSNKEGTKKQSK